MVKLVFSNFISSFLFQLLITVRCVITQLLFDAEHQQQFDEIKHRHTLNEVGDVAESRYN